MTSSMFLSATLLICLLSQFSSLNINCTDSSSCHDTFINCLPHEPCLVMCSSPFACYNSIINCPVDGSCHIQCLADSACHALTIDATLSKGHSPLSILCGSAPSLTSSPTSTD